MASFWNKLDQELRLLYDRYQSLRQAGKEFPEPPPAPFQPSYRVAVVIFLIGDSEPLLTLGFQPANTIDPQQLRGLLPMGVLEEIAALPQVKAIRLEDSRKSHVDPRLKVLLQQQGPATRGLDLTEAPPPPEFVGAIIRFAGDADFLRELGCQVHTVLGNLATVRIPIDRLESVVNHPGVLQVETNRGYHAELDESIKEIKAHTLRNSSPPFGGAGKFTGSGVIVGVIDFGFEYKHRVFRDPADPTKSRILFLYDQTLTPQGGEAGPADGIGGTMIGVEYDKAAIEAALAAADPTTVVRHEPDSHGTHVAGIAAGNGAQGGNCHGAYHYVGVAPDADLILVRLRSGSNQLGTSNNLIDAISYIKRKADTLDKPCVINMSLGDNLGAHDGTSLAEEMIDLFLTILGPSRGFTIIKSAGNQASDKKHAQGSVPGNNAASPLELKFQVTAPESDDDTTTLEIDIWYPEANDLNVQVIPPGNTITGTNTASPGNVNTFTETTKNSTGSIDSSVGLPNSQKRIFIDITPAANDHNLPGEWTIKLTNTGAAAAPFNAWIERDQLATFTTLETSAGTISIPGTSREVITVGNYLCKGKDKGKLSSSSSLGPTADNRMKPEISAPGTNIISARHDPNAGSCCDCCYDFYVGMSGTSMAAPHVAGAVALLLEKNLDLTHEQIKTALTTTAIKDGFTGATAGNRFGEGKMDITAALASITAGSRSLFAPEIAAAPATPVSEAVNTQPYFAPGSPLDRLLATPLGQELHQVALANYESIRELVNTNKRVATVWHRHHGPLLAHHLIRCGMMPHLKAPEMVEGMPVRDCLAAIAEALKTHGDEAIGAAIDRAYPLAIQLPGKSLEEAIELLALEETV
ncbi:MAG: S8 family serine peptidase [Lewinellaceae bacterium]|nr:S8 family serine peptidase [Lewinellaceae bacterium]